MPLQGLVTGDRRARCSTTRKLGEQRGSRLLLLWKSQRTVLELQLPESAFNCGRTVRPSRLIFRTVVDIAPHGLGIATDPHAKSRYATTAAC
jgi:hypothetical protein